jgi:hypothetical protein
MAVPLLFGALTLSLGTALVVRIFAAFGIGIVTYTGAGFLITEADAFIFANFNLLTGNMYSIAMLAGFGEGIKILLASYTAKIGVLTTLGTFKKITFTS